MRKDNEQDYKIHLDVKFQPLELIDLPSVVTIPKGVMHRPRAPQKTVMLMVETKTIKPTGD